MKLANWQRERALRRKRRDLVDRQRRAWDESEKEVLAAKDPAERQFYEQQQQEDSFQFAEEILNLDSHEILRRGLVCHISLTDFQLPDGATSHWETGNYGARYINPKTLREFTKTVEAAEYERAKRRNELNDFRLKVVTAIFAALAAIASILNLFMGNKH